MSSSLDTMPLLSSEYFHSPISTGILSMDFGKRDRGENSQFHPGKWKLRIKNLGSCYWLYPTWTSSVSEEKEAMTGMSIQSNSKRKDSSVPSFQSVTGVSPSLGVPRIVLWILFFCSGSFCSLGSKELWYAREVTEYTGSLETNRGCAWMCIRIIL